MAKKRVKKTAKKKSVSARKTKKEMPSMKSIKPTKNRIRIVLKDLILFVVLTIISYVIYSASESVIYEEFFQIITIVLGFISLAFLISLLVLLFLKLLKKK